MTERIPKAQQADRARNAILAAARRQFSDQGFDRTTIRAVAAAASIDPSMVMRYFGNKDGLFAAAIEIDLRLPDFAHVPVPELGAAVARHFLSRWEAPDSAAQLRVLLASSLTTEVAAQKMAAIFAGQLLPVVSAFGASPAEASHRAGLVATQVLGFALCRYVIRLPPIVEMTHDEAVVWLAPVIASYIIGQAPAVTAVD